MSLVLEIAQTQLGVSKKTQQGIKAIKGYLWVSTHPNYSSSINVNWCGHFAYWVLYWAFNGNVDKLPERAKPLPASEETGTSPGWNTISRFPKKYDKTTSPKSGDLYYRKKNIHGTVHHIGFVADPDYSGSGAVLTLDGNGRGGEVSADLISPTSITYFLSVPD